ncbi:hypothetical protein EYZ11_009204 [Aspergillus tanneri]|uniref:Uncharacterized protein n=1 Tax=Aspergillus tanneri TaxID=1220188 RepID=A0A4S3J8H0_9EURO|nr:hypothetical protein EYZ11_009204 [Aspergillus tanneri]
MAAGEAVPSSVAPNQALPRSSGDNFTEF